jgi:hypothetical protein
MADVSKTSAALLAVLVLGFGDGAGAQPRRWFDGGNLHRAKVPEWRAATSGNRLATSADWALQVESIKKKVEASRNIDTLKPIAQELQNCVDEAVKGAPAPTDVALLAAFCIKLMKW